jgi:hypothetical protein
MEFNIYLGGNLEGLLPVLTRPKSPLKLEKVISDDSVQLFHKDGVLDSFFVYSPPDSEIIEEQLHTEAQNTLGFIPCSCLNYQLNLPCKEKVTAMRTILDYISRMNVAYYLIVSMDKSYVIGRNSRNNRHIISSELKKIMPEISE